MIGDISDDIGIKYVFQKTRVEGVMKSPAPMVNLYDNLSDVEEKFITHRINQVCVVDENRKLLGMISQKYLYKTRSPQKIMQGTTLDLGRRTLVDGDTFYDRDVLDGYMIKYLMNENVHTVEPLDTLEKAVLIMAHMGVDCIPVVRKDHKLCGIVSKENIIQTIVKKL